MKITAQLVNDLMDEALENGNITSFEVSQYVKRKLLSLGYDYSFDELFRLMCDYDKAHPNIYPELLYTWEEWCIDDPYVSDGVYYEYLSSRRQLYSYGFHHITMGFGSGRGGQGKCKPAA